MINRFVPHLSTVFADQAIKQISFIWVLCFSIFCALRVMVLSSGNLVNHYPFMGPDSYDWYVEGIYLVQFLQGESLPNLFVLRPPVFVMICALDYLLGASGYVVGTTLGVCIVGAYALCLRLVSMAQKINATHISSKCASSNSLPTNMLQEQVRSYSWDSSILAITLTIVPIHFFTPFVYADLLACILSLQSIYLLVRWQDNRSAILLLWATLTAAIAGLTQLYAVIPFVIAIVCISLIQMHRFPVLRALLGPVLSLVMIGVLIVASSLAWRTFLPHSITPKNFGLLSLDLEMLSFYKHTWGFYILPIVLMVMTLGKPNSHLLKSSFILQLALVISIILMGLLLFYHWQEARFTYYFFPWLMIFLCTFCCPRNRLSVGIIIIFLLIYSALVPQNYWIPQPRSLELNLRQSWLGDFALAKPVDRGLDKCEANCLVNNAFIAGSEGYTQTMMGIYLQLMDNQQNQEKGKK